MLPSLWLLFLFASYALAEWIRRNELQLLLENCAYGIEYNFKADSGAQLLELARAKSIYVKRQNLLLRQPWVLSQLTNLEQGLMSASMRLYFTFERISYHESTISFKSVLLDYITFTFHLFNMPLIEEVPKLVYYISMNRERSLYLMTSY